MFLIINHLEIVLPSYACASFTIFFQLKTTICISVTINMILCIHETNENKDQNKIKSIMDVISKIHISNRKIHRELGKSLF